MARDISHDRYLMKPRVPGIMIWMTTYDTNRVILLNQVHLMGNLNDENDEYLVTRLLNNIFNRDILI